MRKETRWPKGSEREVNGKAKPRGHQGEDSARPNVEPLLYSGHYFTNKETTLKGFMYRNRDEINDAQATGFQIVYTYIHAHMHS